MLTTDMSRKDNAKSWMVLSIVTFSLFCEVGITKAVSVLLPDIKEQVETQTWIVGSSIAIIVGFGRFLGLLSGGLVTVFSPRVVVFTSGIIAVIGLVVCSAATTPFALLIGLILTGFLLLQENILIGVIPEYFDQYYKTAVAIYCCGSGLGIIIFPVVTQALLDLYGWRGTLLLLSGVCFHSVPFGALIGFGNPEDRKTYQGGDYEQLDDLDNVLTLEERGDTERKCKSRALSQYLSNAFGFSLLQSFPFILDVLIPAMVHGYILNGWIIYMVSYAVSIGLSIRQGSMVATSGGIGVFLVRILLPAFQRFMTYRHLMYIASVLMAFCLVLTTVFDNYVALNILAVIFGTGTGILGVEVHISAKMNTEDSEYYYAVGWFRVVYGISSILSGVVTGLLYDATGSFTMSFNLLAAMSLVITVSLGLRDLCRSKNV